MTCEVCGQSMVWIDCPTGGWWQHLVHPADDHDGHAPVPEERRSLLRDILIKHQQKDVGGCLCGWFKWGASFAAHVLAAYEAALVDDCGCPCHTVVYPGLVPCPRCSPVP